MELATRTRKIYYNYLRASEEKVIKLLRDVDAVNVQELIQTHNNFIACLTNYENSQHEYERVIDDSLLHDECIKAFEIRSRYSDLTNYIEDVIRQKRSFNPFRTSLQNPTINQNNSFESSSVISSTFNTVTGPASDSVSNAFGISTTAQNDPWQPMQNHNTVQHAQSVVSTAVSNAPWQQIPNHDQNIVQNFATPIQMIQHSQPVASTGISNVQPNTLPTINSVSPINQANQTSQINQTNLEPVNSKLDKIKLQIFYGDYEEWQSYWETFESLVHHTNLPVISKFTYLKNTVRGEAQKVIGGFKKTSANYDAAIRELQKRYGRSDLIIQSHIQSLLGDISVEISSSNNMDKYIAALWQFYDNVNVHIRSLESLGIQGHSVEIFLCPILLSKLPDDMRIEWFKKVRPAGNLPELLSFIESYITVLSQSHLVSEKNVSNSKGAKPKSALHTSVEDKPQCLHCKKDHNIENCKKFLAMAVPDRIKRIRFKKACMRCLKKNHIYMNCPDSCSQCSRKHHHLLCLGKGEKTGEKSDDNASGEKPNLSINAPVFDSKSPQAAFVQHGGNKVTVLQTAKSHIIHKTQSVEISILFDSGSDRTYILSNVAHKCNLQVATYEEIIFNSFGTSKSSNPKMCEVFHLNLLGKDKKKYSITAIGTNTISKELYRQKIPSEMLSKFNVNDFADDYFQDRHFTIDLLIGLDHLWDFIDPISTIRHNTLVAQKSVFGWIFSGSFSTNHTLSVITQMCCFNLTENHIKNFWELELMGIKRKEKLQCLESSEIITKFKDELKFENGHYIVSLLWKPKKVNLVNNLSLALKRFLSLERFLASKPNLHQEYFNVFTQYEHEGKIGEVPSDEIEHSKNDVFYLPHFPVVRESSLTTKVRPVFDGSSKSFNGKSLNDALEAGPALHSNIFAILLRFRRWRIALCSDIKAAFHALGLNITDQDVCRFLLRNADGSLRHMKFTVLPFGINCSPFLLNAVIKYHLEKYPKTQTVHELLQNVYVDDFLSGCDSVEVAKEMYEQAKAIMAEGGFTLTKWSTSNPALNQLINIQSQDTSKVLGLSFNLATDCFYFKPFKFEDLKLELTKRLILSILCSLFDPLGIISPFIMYGKIILQAIWRIGLDWDEIPPKKFCSDFISWILSSKSLNEWQLKRPYFTDIPWSSITSLEVHGFGDASCLGFGSVVYLRVHTDKGFETSFVAAKSRVSPVQSLTLPRLELMACLLTARLVETIVLSLEFEVSSITISKVFWTDSMVSLQWIRSDPYQLQVFVSNRVQEIQLLSNPADWHHVPSKLNPADLLSRGCLANDLIANPMWLNGPPYLLNNINFDDVSNQKTEDRDLELVKQERKAASLVCLVTSNLKFSMTAFGKFSTIVNILAYILRFIYNCRSSDERMTGPFSCLELQNAELRAVYLEQRNFFSEEIDALNAQRSISPRSPIVALRPFLDENGVLRIQTGRSDNNEVLPYETKFPIILPSGHISELILRKQHLFLKHSGPKLVMNTLRSQYWILDVKRLASKVHRECPRCSRHDSRPIIQPTPAMPAYRVNQTPPFCISGLDNAGPIYCSDNSSHKYYILLITCAVTRSLHLELVDSLEVEDCLLAIRRFAARRGMPSVFISDNAKTFESARNHIYRVYGVHSPQWRFIPPSSPWWGGWWERLVRSVKLCFYKTLHLTLLSRSETETLLIEIEACINSRPLTFLTSDPQDPQALTPSHFLLGRVTGEQLPINIDNLFISPQDLQVVYSVRQGCLKKFWRSWLHEYIVNLPPVATKTHHVRKVNLGDLVLLRQDNVRRLFWPLGRITRLYPGKDHVVRSVDVKMQDGTILKRSVQMLHHVETFESDDTIECDFESFENRSHVQNSNEQNVIETTENRSHAHNSNEQNVISEMSDGLNLPEFNLDIENSQGSEDTGNMSETPLRFHELVNEENVEGVEGASNPLTSLPKCTTRSGRPVRAPNKLNLYTYCGGVWPQGYESAPE